MSFKYQILAIGLTAFILIFLQPVYVQAYSCLDDPSKYYTKGLASTPNLRNDLKKTADSKCIVDPKAAFAPYKIPSYEDLKSLYYTQSKSTRKSTYTPATGSEANQGNVNAVISSSVLDYILLIDGGLKINDNLLLSGPLAPIVIFVKNTLTISTDINFGSNSPTVGLVFVVGENVFIDKSVNQINAVIISEGNICTAATTSTSPPSCPTGNIDASPLTVYGSLISISPDSSTPHIKFRRRLADNSQPAEKIIHQPKYLVILRNLMSDTLQKWSEIQ